MIITIDHKHRLPQVQPERVCGNCKKASNRRLGTKRKMHYTYFRQNLWSKEVIPCEEYMEEQDICQV